MMGKCKKYVTPVRQQWSYVFLELTHRNDPLETGLSYLLTDQYKNEIFVG